MANSYPPVLLLLFFVSNSMAKLEDGELQTLLKIKRDWVSPAALGSWKVRNSESSYCNWAGVVCGESGQVTALSFPGFQMAKPIPASVCSLKNLTSVDLSYNNLTGGFPTVLYTCSALQFLDLSNNYFTGILPDDINKLSSEMQHLNLSSNAFFGDVPSAIAGFPKLKSLLLDTNSFNGTYPGAAMGGLVELETLTLASNPFKPGPVPEEFGKLTKLKLLWLSRMNLTDAIPDALSPLTELTLFDVSQNKMQGRIPEWVWKLQKLEFLYLFANNFIGEIRPDITAFNLKELDLSMNKLTGPIPENVGSMKNLTLLYMYFNNLTGPIPASVAMLPNLIDIRLFSNRLSGHLPPELGKHSELGNFEVSNNNLSGELPDTLCFNKKLYDLVVFNNSFSGVFPANLGDCDTINNVMAYNNRFAGDFPKKIWSFSKLTTVMIQDNGFTGALPGEISSNISRIQMGNNRFTGAVPSSAVGLKSFKAENNLFSGALPADMSAFANLTELDLAGNQLSGSIPSSIQSLGRLTYLNLSNNNISGEIPAAIGSLPVLIILDLSSNELAGDIPQEFNNLHLNSLNLSSNQLSGEVPESLQNSPYYFWSFLSNPGLCCGSESSLHLQRCPWSHSPHHHLATGITIVLVILPSVTLASVAITGWLLFKRKNDLGDVTSWKMTQFRTVDFSEHDIVSKLSEGNVIGRGGSGKVYRIHLPGDVKSGRGGGTVAVKRISNAGKPEANLDKEFESEVRTLGDLRHSNIIDLLCCISSQETKLLVYEHMENGSLDQWLRRHKRAGKIGPLDWPTRLSIAVDVARGLSYMHEGFVRPVIHRDVKSSNILLDCKFRAKIADFGLARMIAKSGESESASAVCGTFGYIAPEYVYRAKVSEKADVYSFGVVLLELATGRGPQDGGTDSGSCLAKWASKRYKNGGPIADLVDEEIQEPAYLDDMVAVFELGVACIGEDPTSRPPMSEVLHRLVQCGCSQPCSDDDFAKHVFEIDKSSYCVV